MVGAGAIAGKKHGADLSSIGFCNVSVLAGNR
jgi:hypothetical protein